LEDMAPSEVTLKFGAESQVFELEPGGELNALAIKDCFGLQTVKLDGKVVSVNQSNGLTYRTFQHGETISVEGTAGTQGQGQAGHVKVIRIAIVDFDGDVRTGRYKICFQSDFEALLNRLGYAGLRLADAPAHEEEISVTRFEDLVDGGSYAVDDIHAQPLNISRYMHNSVKASEAEFGAAMLPLTVA